MRNTRKAALAALGATALPLLTATPASADPPPRVTVKVVSLWGCGGTNSAVATVTPPSPDGFGVSVYTAAFKASAGKDVPAEEARITCNLTLIINLPLEYTWVLKSTKLRGTADLAPEATGEVATRNWIQGKDPGREISRTIKAPTQSWRLEDQTPLENPCGEARFFTISTRLQVTAADTVRASSISMNEPPDGRADFTFGYKSCKPS
ncbi:DUF4360 domain-containing protein [Actinomadura terrae]|uniref:DUF4360 domain-containing protein n=1 Tax=Actinomadura terrae TaxID=604353 RepID=UPI001FA7D7DF|nr:DUF4360 domain-containing protein [Actinomadura terrae]